jgi:cytochrome c-type biogenesis protein CcmE
MKPKIVIGVLIIVSALIYLVASGFQDNASFYLTVSELQAKTDLTPEDGVRIQGYVDPASIAWDAEKIELYFNMNYEGDTVRVYYKGIKPDQLADAQQVVCEGHIESDGEFTATKIMLKCPSKYEVEASEESGQYNKASS